MIAHVLSEPPLEFRPGCRHIDPRVGLMEHGPADLDAQVRPDKVTVGLVGPAEHLEGIQRWLERCREPIDRRAAKPGQENLFLDFPGFNTGAAFASELVFDTALVREIPNRDLRRLANTRVQTAVAEAVDIYAERAQSLAETGRCEVIICGRPDELDDSGEDSEPRDLDEEVGGPAAAAIEDETTEVGRDFHDLLKARTLSLNPPLQLLRRETWEGKTRKDIQRELQDEATRAWNLHVALYYKAGGTPWRLPRHSTDLQSCFVGISFYRTPDEIELRTAVAQVFNERGDGVVVRGGAATITKTDRQPHLSEDDARRLLYDALGVYKTVHGHLPARVVIHKSSSFNRAEVAGLQRAADEREVDHLELIWITGAPRFFRNGTLPPLRGTTVELEPGALVLYTRGSIEFFRTYPGLYVPRPLLLRSATPGVDLRRAGVEVLGLSKMNWNNAQLDERDPLTLRTSRRVGGILKHVPAGQSPSTRYAKYM